MRYTTPQPSSEAGFQFTGLPTPPEENRDMEDRRMSETMDEDISPMEVCRVPTLYQTEEGRPMSAPAFGLPLNIGTPGVTMTNADESDIEMHEVRTRSEEPPMIIPSGRVSEGKEWMDRPMYSGWR
jgi:hypothetical protein